VWLWTVCRATLDFNLRHFRNEISSLHDQQAHKMREKDVELRKLKKANLQLKAAGDNLQNVEKMYDKTKTDVRTSHSHTIT